MATVTITIPDEYANIVVAALCDTEGTTPTAANAKKVVVNYIKDTTINYKRRLAYEQNVMAIDTAKAQLDTATATAEAEAKLIAIA